jgi:separase
MLWGCSSGALREQGDFDRVGTALHYMVGGCPSLTANLWDVTDRDIDRLCENVFNRMGVGPQPTGNESTAAAVNASRGVCKLGYLTGAAPVVYGIPKRLVGNGIFSA